MNARKITEVIAVTGALVTLGLMLYASRSGGAGSQLFLAGVIVWGLAPYAILLWAARLSVPDSRWAVSIAALTLLMTCVTLVGYYIGIFVRPDAQGGLMFLAFPFYQIAVAVLVLLVTLVVKRRT